MDLRPQLAVAQGSPIRAQRQDVFTAIPERAALQICSHTARISRELYSTESHSRAPIASSRMASNCATWQVCIDLLNMAGQAHLSRLRQDLAFEGDSRRERLEALSTNHDSGASARW